MGIEALIEKAKGIYAAAGLNCGDALLPAIDDAAIDALGRSLSLPIPSELREVYRVHGGQAYVPPGVTGLFGEHRLHAPAQIVEHYRMNMDHCRLDPPPAFPPPPNEWGYWVVQLMPFASWDAYQLCIHSDSGEVWEFEPNAGLLRQRASISAVLEEVIKEVQAGREPRLGAMRLDQQA